MKSASWIIALFVGMIGTVEARAQFFFSNSVVVSPFGAARSSSFVRLGPRPAFATVHYRWYFPTYYYPYSNWEYPYLGSGIYYSNPTVIINAPAPVAAPPRQAPEELPKGKVIIKRGKEEAAEKPAPPLPGKDAGGFRPIEPADRVRAQEPLPPEPPKKQEAKPQTDPRPTESPPAPVDFVIRGKQAFAAGEYGRAERFFQQAAAREPQSHLAHFLLAQAQFALDKYREADDAILAGLRLEADWPKSKFRPEELYADRRTDFQEQLGHLKSLLDGKPADPVLLNLYAYQLWFSGQAEDAKPYFRRAAEIAADKSWTDFFLINHESHE
jgi:tetratricopeptide (TPR) repeat protein